MAKQIYLFSFLELDCDHHPFFGSFRTGYLLLPFPTIHVCTYIYIHTHTKYFFLSKV